MPSSWAASISPSWLLHAEHGAVCCAKPAKSTLGGMKGIGQGAPAHWSVRLLCALEAEGGPALAGDIHWLPSHIDLHLHGILAACIDTSYLLCLL